MVKRAFADQEFVIARDSGRLYKAKILKGVALRSTWKYFVHYDQWNIKHDKWVEEEDLMAYTGKLLDIKWPLLGMVVAKFQEKMRGDKAFAPAVEGKDAGTDATASEPLIPVETEEQAKKRRKMILMQNLLVEEPGVEDIAGRPNTTTTGAAASGGSSSKQSIAMPVLLKKYLVDDWSNISVETCVPPPGRTTAEGVTGPSIVAPYTKLLRLPRPYSVSTIISMFLEHKHAAIIGNNTSAPPDESAVTLYQSYVDVLSGLQNYFNGAHPTILLYRQEREQLEVIRSRIREHNRAHGTNMHFVPAHIYGVEHLVRLMVKLPTYLNTSVLLAHQQEHNKLIQRVNELLKFIVKHSGLFFGHSPRISVVNGSDSSVSAGSSVATAASSVHSMKEQAYLPSKDALRECAEWDPSTLEIPDPPIPAPVLSAGVTGAAKSGTESAGAAGKSKGKTTVTAATSGGKGSAATAKRRKR